MPQQMMGVINITPNSFSDGGRYNSAQTFAERLEMLLAWKVTFIDVGAQSTAPFNDPIAAQEEAWRFEECLWPALQNYRDQYRQHPFTLSIDTYRPEIFHAIYWRAKALHPQFKLIWNDVSGVLDETTAETLQDCSDADYIFCHNLAADRNKSFAHMKTVLPLGDVRAALVGYFSAGREFFAARGFTERVYFDPTFGFSKSTEQNISLLQQLPLLVKEFLPNQRWVLGISRKSFLRKLTSAQTPESDSVRQAEYAAVGFYIQWLKTLQDYSIVYRLHDPAVFKMALEVAHILNGI
jgi:dihydropteroate synthase